MTSATKRIEVSRDGVTWLPVLMREVAEVDARPESVLPEGHVWEKHGGRWVPAIDETALWS